MGIYTIARFVIDRCLHSTVEFVFDFDNCFPLPY
jgi:hypothetical protein